MNSIDTHRPPSLSSDDLQLELHSMHQDKEKDIYNKAKLKSGFPIISKITAPSSSDTSDLKSGEAQASCASSPTSPQVDIGVWPSNTFDKTLISNLSHSNVEQLFDGAEDILSYEDEESFTSLLAIVIQHDNKGHNGEDNDTISYNPINVDNKVQMVIHKWGPVGAMNPEDFFLKLLSSRGFEIAMIPALTSQYRR